MKEQQRVSALRGGQPGNLAANRSITIKFSCAGDSMRRKIAPTAWVSRGCRIISCYGQEVCRRPFYASQRVTPPSVR
jgi:hypothetical protein